MAPGSDGSDAVSDAVLLERFAAGDQSAARALSDQLLPGALRQAYRMLGDQAEAEDVAQDAMLRLWKQATDWRAGEARVSTWLYRVVHNLCIDRIRKVRDAMGINHFNASLWFGDMAQDRVLKSMRLFAEEVMPALQD